MLVNLVVLTSGFSEANTDATLTPIRQCALESEYDYEMDSDLEEFEEKAVPPNIVGPSIPATSKGKGRFEEVHTDEPAAEKAADSQGPKANHHEILIPSIAHRT